MDLSLPKVELHCHLDGVLGAEMAREICREHPGFILGPDDLQRGLPVTDLATFWAWWDVIRPLMGDVANFLPVLEKHINHLKAQRVVYAEIMIASGGLSRDSSRAVEQVRAVREITNQLEGGEIQIEFLIGFGRNRSAEDMELVGKRALALHAAGLIVGAALAGPEPGYPVKPFQRTFARFHEAGLGIMIHAGEWCGPESVWDALEHGYPDRIGHGVSLFQDPRLIDLFLQRQIHVEMCPTSNVKTASVARIEDHPIGRARELGMNFSLNTDDPGPFGSSMESEYELVTRLFGFDEGDWQRVYRNSLAARFQPRLRVAVQ